MRLPWLIRNVLGLTADCRKWRAHAGWHGDSCSHCCCAASVIVTPNVVVVTVANIMISMIGPAAATTRISCSSIAHLGNRQDSAWVLRYGIDQRLEEECIGTPIE